MTSDAAGIETRLTSIISYVQDCERRVLRGEFMDLKGLDRNVMEICEAMTALPRAEALALEGRMQEMIARLDALAQSMREQQDKIRTRA